MANIGDLVATATLDIAPFMTNTKNLKTYMRGLDSSLKAVEKSISGQGKSFTGLTSLYKQTGQSLTAYQALLTKQSEKYNQLKSNIGDINNATSSQKTALAGARAAMTETAAKVAELQGRYQALAREMAIQSSVFTKAGNAFQSFGGKLSSISSTTGKISSATRDMSLIIGAGMGYGITKAAEFNNSMTSIQALLADTVPANKMNSVITKLGDNSKKWAVEYGLSTKSVNAGMQELVKAGYNANQVTASMPAILNASKASGEDFNTVMQATTSILSQYKLGAREAGRVTDSLTFVANKTKAGFKDMGDAMVYVGPVAKSLGMNVEQTASAIGLLSNAGIQGEKAGTALRGALTRLLKPSKQNAAAMRELGFSAEEFKRGQIDLPGILDRIKQSTEGMTDAEKASLIAKAFGTEAQTAMNALVNEGSASLRNLTNETRNAAGYTQQLAKAMNSTDAAKFEQAKAKLEVLAITIGQKLLPTIVPLVEDVADLASKFADLPEGVQESILKFGMFLAVISPISGAISKTTGLLGGLSTGFGKVLGALGKVGADKSAAAALEGVATSAGKTSTAVGLLSNPLGLMVGTTALLAGGMVLLADAQDRAREKADKFGTSLSGENTQKLNAFSNEVNNAKVAMVNFETGATTSSEKVKKAVTSMLDEIKKGASETNQKLEELAKKYGIEQSVVDKAKEKNNQIVNNSQTMADQINAIYDKHNGKVAELTTAEKTIVESNMRELVAARVGLLGLSKDKERAILKTFNGDVGSMTRAQLKEQASILKSAMADEQKLYKSQKADLKQLLDNGLIDQQTYNSKMSALKTQHNATLEQLGEALVKVSQEQMAKSGGLVKYTEEARKVLAQYGMSFEDLAKKASQSTNALSNAASMVGTYTSKMSEDARNATDQWNALVLDPKTGEVKTNAPEEVAKALLAENGWANMEFVLKNANIQSNARAQIADALIAQGQWDSTTPEQKELIFQNANGLQAIYESKSQLEIWNAMPEKVKNLLANDTDFSTKASVARATLEKWNSLTPAQKELIATNNTSAGVTAALSMMMTVPETKNTNLTASDNTQGATGSAQSGINSVKQYGVPSIFANNATGSATSSAQAGINSVRQPFPAPINATDATPGPVTGAKRSINSVQGKTVTISAIDRASGVISGIASWLGSLRDKVVNVVTRHTSNEKGTNFHPGGLALVNDQKGSLYRELVTLPNGVSFIPEGRDVMLPLPRGSKVLRASLTKQLFPHYADGIGFNETNISTIAKRIGEVKETKGLIVNNDNSDIRSLLNQLIRIMTSQGTNSDLASALEIIKLLSARPIEVSVEAREKVIAEILAKPITEEQQKRQAILNAVEGLGW